MAYYLLSLFLMYLASTFSYGLQYVLLAWFLVTSILRITAYFPSVLFALFGRKSQLGLFS